MGMACWGQRKQLLTRDSGRLGAAFLAGRLQALKKQQGK
jgi:hypothetical protein